MLWVVEGCKVSHFSSKKTQPDFPQHYFSVFYIIWILNFDSHKKTLWMREKFQQFNIIRIGKMMKKNAVLLPINQFPQQLYSDNFETFSSELSHKHVDGWLLCTIVFFLYFFSFIKSHFSCCCATERINQTSTADYSHLRFFPLIRLFEFQ